MARKKTSDTTLPIEAGNQARSDYTYSASLTYRDRVTPDRKIGSPNMARRGLRGGNISYTRSPDFSSSDLSIGNDDSSQLNLRTRTILRPMDALSDNSDVEEEVAAPVARRTRSSRSRSSEVVPRVNGSTVTRTVTSTYTTTKTLHRGLDVESDVDDGTESTVPQRATPFTARSGTPLARAGTPASRANSRASVSGDGVGRGYTLAKGAIAEDVEEEEAESESLLTWRRLSWHTVKRVTTFITTTVIMMAVRTVTAQQQQQQQQQQSSTSDSISTSSSSSESLSKHSLWSSVRSTSRWVVDASTRIITSSREHLKRRPLLIWIPLIPLLLLLLLVASWWLLQSGAKTGDSADPSQTTEGPSFLSYTLSTASQLTNLVTGGISRAPVLAWEAGTGALGWVMSMFTAGISALWTSVTSMATWLWSVLHAGLTLLLQTLYLMLELLQVVALAVANFFFSSVSYIFGFLLPVTHTKGSEGAESESSAWISQQASIDWVSWAYTSVSEGARKTQTWLWEGWLWLVISVADALTAVASSLLWLLGLVWSLLGLLVSGLWTVLVYICTGTAGLLSSASAAVTSSVVEVSSLAAGSVQMLFLPLYKKSGSAVKDESSVRVSRPGSLDGPGAGVAEVSVDDIVRRVLSSAELAALITSISSQNAARTHSATEDIHLIVKTLVEGELEGHKAEAAALWESHSKAAAQESQSHLLSVEEKQSAFLMQLGQLEAEVARLQGSVQGGREGHDLHHHRLEALSTKITQLTLQLQELEANHSTLAAEVKSCCKNTSVTLADVEKHVTVLLGDILGLSSGQKEGEGHSWSVADMSAWLRSYFVAKEELETRLNTLTATLQRKSVEETDLKESTLAANNAAIAQSTQIIMETVLEKLRAEIQKQHEQLGEAAKEEVSQQVNSQMQAAANVLGQQMSDQVEHELHSSKQQLQNIVSVAVQEALPEHVASALPKAVAGAVSEAVATAVPDAVSNAVPNIVEVAVDGAVKTVVHAAVDTAVNEAVAAAVPGAVSGAVPGVVNTAVANAVNEAVQEAVPGAVNAAVQETVAVEIQGAVSEAVASALPAVVSTAVNETVASRISEALVNVGLSKAGSTGTGETSGDGMVVIAGTHSDMGGSSGSSSSSSATLAASVNVSNNGKNGSNIFAPVSLPMTAGLNESDVIRIVKEALLKYDADKTGMVDYALESAGGNIISTRCTEGYQVHVAELTILGFPVFWYPTNNNPRIIIQPERMPGQCWAFKGSQGYIVIKLASNILPTGFTMEHIPKSLSPSGEIDSAPREFEVWGLHSENDEGVLLGKYEYDQNGDPFQFFAVQEANTEYFPMIELKINSNHGNLQYTCLYRFRVHGVRHF